MPPLEHELIALARDEAKAIVEEAQQQAQMLIAAADAKTSAGAGDPKDVRAAAVALAGQLERSIAVLTQILEALRNQLD